MYWISMISGVFITVLSVLKSITNLTELKLTKLKKFLFCTIFSLVFSLLFIYTSGLQKLCLSYALLVLNFYIFCFNNLNQSMYYSFITLLISSFGEFIFSIIFILIFHNSKVINVADFPLAIVLSSFFNALLLFFFSINKFSKNLVKKFENSNRFIIFIILVIMSTIFILLFKNYSKFGNNFEFYLNLLLYFSFVIIILALYNNMLKSQKYEIQYNQMLEYVTKYESIINEQGKKNHEYNNQLMILSGYLQDDKYDKVKEYLNSIIGEHRTGQNYEIRQLSHFPNGGLKGLMYYKIKKMEENGIKYYLYVSQDVQEEFDKFDLSMYQDITKIFGVFIDNAIDAAKDSEKKEVEIDIKSDDDYVMIVINNTYQNSDVSKVGKSGYSTKGKGHGYGLSLVRDIVRKNDQIDTVSEYDNEMYSQTLLIDIKNKNRNKKMN